eukprot:432189-Pelagomonas_calceolata.AAC.5
MDETGKLDASADGYVRAEASAMMALARPSIAEAQGIPVLGLIANSSVNQTKDPIREAKPWSSRVLKWLHMERIQHHSKRDLEEEKTTPAKRGCMQ